MNRTEEMRQQVNDFHNHYPEVRDMFVQFTFEMIKRGYKNYSAKAIFERIRWEKDSVGGDGVTSFKLNNNYTAFYSRRFARVYPQHESFFRTREQTSEERGATHKPELTPSYYA
jgi:hypothetical protein